MAERRQAAVIIGILRAPERAVIFVERAAHLRDHPGQIGLPGGGVDPQDANLWETALRELREEVGVGRERVKLIGELPLVRQRVNTFDVTPFVALIDPGELRIDPRETAAVFTVPLEKIMGPDLCEGTVQVGNLRIATPVLDHEGYRIWGLTGKILQSFVAAWPTLSELILTG